MSVLPRTQAAMRLLLVVALCSNVLLAYPNQRTFNLTEFVRLRCSLDPADQVVTTWKGSAYIHIYQMQPRCIFDISGMNVARCLFNEAQREVILTSREVQLYLDPTTGQKLNQWNNPFTGETVPVMHVANDPVQNSFSMDRFSINGYQTSPDQVVIPSDVNLFYSNPLYDNETLRTYSKEQFYQAAEFFKFFTALHQIDNASLNQVDQMDLSWTRVSPVLPWMNMSMSHNATLVFSAQGTKVRSLNQIDPALLNEINARIPIYRDAPTCQLDTRSETSWTYFKKYFAEYLSQGQEFPIPKFNVDAPCVPTCF